MGLEAGSPYRFVSVGPGAKRHICNRQPCMSVTAQAHPASQQHSPRWREAYDASHRPERSAGALSSPKRFRLAAHCGRSQADHSSIITWEIFSFFALAVAFTPDKSLGQNLCQTSAPYSYLSRAYQATPFCKQRSVICTSVNDLLMLFRLSVVPFTVRLGLIRRGHPLDVDLISAYVPFHGGRMG